MSLRFAKGGIVPAFTIALACSPAPPQKMVSEEALAIAVQKNVDLEERFDAERKELRATIASLEVENADLRSRLGVAENEARDAGQRAVESQDAATRYQAGLNRAVGELNRVSSSAAAERQQAAANAAYAAAAAPRGGSRDSDVFFASPSLSIVDRSLFASGSAHNSGSTDVVGTLRLTLVRDGVELETVRQPFSLVAGNWHNWSHQFSIPGPGGQYGVRAALER